MANKNLKLAKYILEESTLLLGSGVAKIDAVFLDITYVKVNLGFFKKEIEEFVNLLKDLKIIDNIRYTESDDTYRFDIGVSKMKKFIKQGAGGATVFDPIKSCIFFSFSELSIPRDTNQFDFCKKMYEYPTNEWVSWDLIYSESKGLNTIQKIPDKSRYKVIYDTMTEINKKAKEKLSIDNLFKYNKHEFLRTI